MEDVRIARSLRKRVIAVDVVIGGVAPGYRIAANPTRHALMFATRRSAACGLTLHTVDASGIVPFASCYVSIGVAGNPNQHNNGLFLLKDYGQLILDEIALLTDLSSDPLTITELYLEELLP
jgi:hypothetical protein